MWSIMTFARLKYLGHMVPLYSQGFLLSYLALVLSVWFKAHIRFIKMSKSSFWIEGAINGSSLSTLQRKNSFDSYKHTCFIFCFPVSNTIMCLIKKCLEYIRNESEAHPGQSLGQMIARKKTELSTHAKLTVVIYQRLLKHYFNFTELLF